MFSFHCATPCHEMGELQPTPALFPNSFASLFHILRRTPQETVRLEGKIVTCGTRCSDGVLLCYFFAFIILLVYFDRAVLLFGTKARSAWVSPMPTPLMTTLSEKHIAIDMAIGHRHCWTEMFLPREPSTLHRDNVMWRCSVPPRDFGG